MIGLLNYGTLGTFHVRANINQPIAGILVAKKSAENKGLPSFEEALEELEGIVSDLEEGELGLADAMGRYEQGVKHLRRCYGLLESAQRKIEQLTKVTEDGTAITEPFDDSGTLEQVEKGKKRTRRKAKSSPAADGGEEEDTSGSLF